MNYPKYIGWLLLISGIILIAWTSLKSYNIFVGKVPPPKIFEAEEEPEKNLTEIEEMVKGHLEKAIPPRSINKLFNLISWSVLAFILIFSGGQIIKPGTRLIINETRTGS